MKPVELETSFFPAVKRDTPPPLLYHPILLQR